MRKYFFSCFRIVLLGVFLLFFLFPKTSALDRYSISIFTDKESYYPNENLTVNVFIQDYEKNLVYTGINIIFSSEKGNIYNQTILSNKAVNIPAKKLIPGDIKITAIAELSENILVGAKNIQIINISKSDASNLRNLKKSYPENLSLNTSKNSNSRSPLTRIYTISEKNIKGAEIEKNCLIYAFVLCVVILFAVIVLRKRGNLLKNNDSF